jgi:hypothetical protein
MRKVSVDFNDPDMTVSEKRGGHFDVGEIVLAYTTDDVRPFGCKARVRGTYGVGAFGGNEIYYLEPVSEFYYDDEFQRIWNEV